jgi:NAD+ kinase
MGAMAGQRPHGYTIGLVVHPVRPVRDSVEVITRFGRANGVAVVAREADADRVGPGVDLVAADAFADRLDAVLSLGGDGTMLGAMRLVVGRQVPVLGVNHGNLGFLVEVGPAELEGALARVMAGDFTLEPHSALDLTIGDAPARTAFNDVVFTAAEPLTTMTIDLLVDGSRHGYYRGDALIACTPTGSTAYNYAAGGPVISPSAPSIALTPVAPMSGISRSVLFGGGDAVALQNPAPERTLQFSVDGSLAGRLEPQATAVLRLRADAVSIVRLDAGTYARRNRVKLSLLDLPLRPDQLLELIPQPLRDRAEQLRGGAG